MLIKTVPLSSVLALRQRVLRPNLTAQDCRFPTDDHPQATHFALHINAVIVGICSVAPEAAPLIHGLSVSSQMGELSGYWRLRMMATAPEVRGQGLGKQLLQTAEQFVSARLGTGVWCNARLSAQGFYQQQGYSAQGEVFHVATVGPHIVMIKPLLKSSAHSD